MTYLKKQLEKRIEQDLIRKQKHPFLDLEIYNYTHECQFSGNWDKYTKMSRGLVLDSVGKVVARPFDKFFNLSEHNKILEEMIEEHGEISKVNGIIEKMDGSLIIVFIYDGEVIVATRGSFGSDQSMVARDILEEKGYLSVESEKRIFFPDITYLFEVIYPENRIVVDYQGRRELVFLGARHTGEGTEMHGLGLDEDFTVPSKFHKIEDHIDNAEGYVIQFVDGTRVKIKFEDYVRLHRIMTGFSPKRIWESLKNGDIIDLTGVPEEFSKQVTECQSGLFSEYGRFVVQVETVFENTDTDKSRGEIAREWMKDNKDLAPMLFARLDGKSYKEAIWKKIKPVSEKKED